MADCLAPHFEVCSKVEIVILYICTTDFIFTINMKESVTIETFSLTLISFFKTSSMFSFTLNTLQIRDLGVEFLFIF